MTAGEDNSPQREGAAPHRALVAGSGSIAQRHIRNLLALGVQEVIVWSQRDTLDEQLFADGRVTPVRELPSQCPTVAVVANDTDRHVETARVLVAEGANVLVEKPLAASLSQEAMLLCDEVASRGLVGRVAYNMRFLGAIREVQSIVRGGVLGRLLFAQIEAGQWLPDWRPNRSYSESYSASESRGGGVDLDLSHEVDYMRMLFGQPQRWVANKARTSTLDIETPDVFDAMYVFANDFACAVHLDYLAKTPRRAVRVVGTDGEIRCDLVNRVLTLDTAEGGQVFDDPRLFDVDATYVDELKEFFAEATTASASDMLSASLEDGCAVLRLLSDGPWEAI